ncbi:MAG: hypothetical protein ATN36_07970 [Epulopiscium sp. Nele67-Bin005]|nr:MAG: hypothetical protein ATN36_07970 [Epulopiscium sp. Nele67-Bin005]
MKDNIKKLFELMMSASVIMVFVVGFYLFTVLAGATIMTWFGFEYKSIQSVIIFFVVADIISIPIELLIKIVAQSLLSKGATMNMVKAFYVIACTINLGGCMALMDYYMRDIVAPDLAILVIGIISSFLDVNDLDQQMMM